MFTKYSLLGVLLQCMFFNLMMASEGRAQKYLSVKDVYVQLEFNNTSLRETFHQIESVTNFKFSYNREDIDLELRINMKAKKQSVGDILYRISELASLKFKQINENITVGKLRFPESTPPVEIIIEEIEVHGKVNDDQGEPLPGVSIIVKNTTQGTITDLDGNYRLTVSEDDTLVFSFVGFLTEEVPVDGRSIINIKLLSDIAQLQEVVVIGYGTQRKSDLTGSISQVGAEDIEKLPAASVEHALQGKTPGVRITQNSGRPGSSVSVNIRGIGSFGNNEPLYVVDGFPLQDISFLNPNNIKSISILKDASAAAIYGVRANAGVVIIETKSGTSGDLNVSIDSWVGVQSEPEQIELLQAQEFANFAIEVGESQGKEVLEEWKNPGELKSINWQNYAFDRGFRQGHNISIQGGGEKSTTALSIGMIEEDGVVIASSYQRYNISLNSNYRLTENLNAQANIKYAHSKNFLGLSQGYYGFMKVFRNVPYLSDKTGTNEPYDSNGNYGAFTESALINSSSNVLANALQRDTDNGRNILLGNLVVDYSFLNGFTATGKFGFHTQNYAGWTFSPKYDRGINDDNPFASYGISQNTSKEFIVEGLLKYKKQLGRHGIELLLGASTQEEKFDHVNVTGRGFLNNQIRDMSAAEEIISRSGTWGTSTIASTFARANYSYNHKYMITATVRRDGVGDKFSRSNLYGTFPSVALGWNINQEAFMQNAGFDLLKLRGSWGETGNSQGIPPFQFLTYYTGGSTTNDAGYVFGGEPVSGLAPETLANPDLTWESQVQFDIGLDGELLGQKLYFTFDYFEKSAKDFLLNETIPHQTGFTSRAVNAGNVVNKGLEILLGYRNHKGDFTWDVSANFTTIHNEITKLTEGQDFLVFESVFVPSHIDNWLGFTRSYVGGNVGTFYGYKADGIFQTQEEIDYLNERAPDGIYQESTGTNPIAPGDRRFVDLNGDGQISAEDRKIIGSPIPDFYGGLNFNARYKNLELGLSFYGSYGNDILNFVKVELENIGSYGATNAYTNVSKEYYNNRWTPDNPSNTYSRAVVEDVNKNSRVSDYFVEDGSFLRLRNVQLAYNLNSDFLESAGFDNVRIYISGQNLLTFTNYSGLDPEIGTVTDLNGRGGVQTRGVDFGAYPIAQTFTLGINVQF